MTRTAATPTLTRLQHGETLHLPLDAGTTLHIAAGTVVLREPLRWLGDTVVAPVVTLSEGQSRRLGRQGGWVELRALSGAAAIRSERPVPAWYAAWRAWRRDGTRGPSGQRDDAQSTA